MHVGNYTLSELLGRGGTSEVYAAQHRFLGDAVAIKLLRAGAAEDARVREAFVAEAARTREIQHPAIVRVLDFGHDDASGSLYLVMERVAGETLAARLKRIGRLDEPTLRRLAAALADGMQAAHARGIVHRDLKPGNVMLRADAGDAPVIVDFGIAKSLGASSAVHTERRIGTVAYMAPEQLTDGLVTPAADIWALGVILYEAATGQLPFGNFADGRLPQLFDTPARAATLASISPALDDLIARCLERDPGKRPAAMADVAAALRGDAEERITADVGATFAVPSTAPRAEPAPRRRWPILAAATGLLAVAGAGVLIARPSSREQPPATEPAPITMPAAVTLDAAVETVEVAAPEPPQPAEERPGERPAATEAKKKRPRRTKPHAHETRQRKTSQGETLD
ncbi:MAG TPA: protein kinase [Kofleriaceae bacterium]|nr:protein kinase [Kofleriaceae bacterium]